MADTAPVDPTIDAREALYTALLDWRYSLTRAASLHSGFEIVSPQRQALKSSSDPDAIFWLECEGIESATYIEPVELLALAARIDYPLWRRYVREVFDDVSDWADVFESRTSLRVGVHVIASDRDCRNVPGYSRMIVDSLTGPRTARYEKVRELMERVLGMPLETLPRVPVWLDCTISDDSRGNREDDIFFDEDTDGDAVHDSDDDEDYGSEEDGEGSEEDEEDSDAPIDFDRLPRLVGQICKVLARQSRAKQAGAMRVTQFTLRPSKAATEPRFITVDPRAIDHLRAIRALGIRVTDLPTMCFDYSDGSAHEETLASVRALLDATKQQATTVPGAERCAIVHLGARLCDDVTKSLELAQRVFSAVQASDSLRSVMIDFKNMARKRPHGDGKAAYGEAARKQLVWWMTYGLFARRRPLETIDITAGAMRIEDVESMAELWNASDPLALLVCDEAQDATPALEPVTFKSPAHLEVRCARCPEALLALLRLVGHDVKVLTIRATKFKSPPSPASFCEQILMACPHLEDVEIPELTQLKPLVELLRTGRLPQLRGLALTDVRVAADSDVLHLFDALSQPQHPLAEQLRRLQVSACTSVQRGTLDTALAMLRTNTRLYEVMFEFKIVGSLADADEYQELFKSLDRSSVVEPFPTPRALALVSAIRATSPCGPLGAFARFDSDIVRRVLMFAPTTRTRSVDATVREDPYADMRIS